MEKYTHTHSIISRKKNCVIYLPPYLLLINLKKKNFFSLPKIFKFFKKGNKFYFSLKNKIFLDIKKKPSSNLCFVCVSLPFRLNIIAASIHLPRLCIKQFALIGKVLTCFN